MGAYVFFIAFCSSLAGLIYGQWSNAIYWSALTSLLAFLAVAGGNLPDPSVGVGWGLVGLPYVPLEIS